MRATRGAQPIRLDHVDAPLGAGHMMTGQCQATVMVCGGTHVCASRGAEPVQTVCTRGHWRTDDLCQKHRQMAASGRGRCERCHVNGLAATLRVLSAGEAL